MPRSTLVLQHLLVLNSVSLGRLVTNPSLPTQSYHTATVSTTWKSPDDFTATPSGAYQGFQEKQRNLGFRAALDKLVRAHLDTGASSELSLESKQVKTYYLHNTADKFDALVADEAVRKWFEKAIKRGTDVYMVVGLQTILDASLHSDAQRGHAGGVGLDVKDPHSQTLGVRAEGSADASSHQMTSFVAEHEQVYAIQYQKIVFTPFSSKTASDARLNKKAHWELYWKVRGPSAEGPDMVEASLEAADFENGFDV
ncbi:hypothetical protein MBLNU459_g0791t1 [Dothideomycetes sp. NU459]